MDVQVSALELLLHYDFGLPKIELWEVMNWDIRALVPLMLLYWK